MPKGPGNEHTSLQSRNQLGKLFILLLVSTALACASFPAAISADEPNQAALAIVSPKGRIETRCITFDEGAINGADLLNRSGLDVILDASSGMGITVCQVEGLGCAYPTEDCFCQCMTGSGCAYWNYYYRDLGESDWTYSPLGVLLRETRPGSIEAWVWGDGHTAPPAELTFGSVCAPSEPSPTNTSPPPSPSPASTSSSPGAVPAHSYTLAPTEVASVASPTQSSGEVSTRAATQPAVATPPPDITTDEEVSTDPALSSYWPFGLMFLGLVAIGGIAWFRRS